MQFTKKQKVAAALAGGAIAVAGAGIAYAAWNTTGTGDAVAKAGSDAGETFTATGATAVGDLTPGNYGTIVFKVTNTNPYPVTLTKVTVLTLGTSSDNTNCPAGSNLTVANLTTPVSLGTAITVAAGASGASVSIPASDSSHLLKMVADAANGCQNVSFPISTLTLTGASSAS